jgi:hypothetical protein
MIFGSTNSGDECPFMQLDSGHQQAKFLPRNSLFLFDVVVFFLGSLLAFLLASVGESDFHCLL